MADDRFVYVTFIRTTPEKLWNALTQPEFTRCYWCETHQESAWTKGAEWRLCAPDGRVADSGEIVEIDWPRASSSPGSTSCVTIFAPRAIRARRSSWKKSRARRSSP